MECEFPTINANNEEIKAIFEKVKTIAVVGLSPNETKDSHKVAKYLQSAGFKIIPIYPKEEMILGEKVYRSLKEVPVGVDMVNVFRKPDVVPLILDAILEREDVKVMWLQKGIVHNESAQRAKEQGLEVVQNHCSMVEHKMLHP